LLYHPEWSWTLAGRFGALEFRVTK
jgi:hypothetical protein